MGIFDKIFNREPRWEKIEMKALPKWTWMKYLKRIENDKIFKENRYDVHPRNKSYIFKGKTFLYKTHVTTDTKGWTDIIYRKKRVKKKKVGTYWEELEAKKVPNWVKKSFSNSMPSPVSRPLYFSMEVNGKHLKYKMTYSQHSYHDNIDIAYFYKAKKRGKQ